MSKKNIIKVYTTSDGAELNISAPSIKQTISATNNRAQEYAEQAMKYRDEAKQHRDNAKYYSEQNSDVTFDYINNIRADLEKKISMKQDIGDYALKDEIPTTVGKLENDLNYIGKEYVDMKIEENKLPNQESNIGKFLMADGDKGSWMNITAFQLFDTKISDCILQGEVAIGWALQGTYVNGAVYPDFYAKALEEKDLATATEVTLGDSMITMYVCSNGHQYYDIADKLVVDSFYNATGSAWFYGIDNVNQRVFLPRDKYFAVKGNVSVAGNGTALGLSNGTYSSSMVYQQGQTYFCLAPSSTPVAANLGTSIGISTNGVNTAWGITTDSTKSGIEGQLTANINKHLYICVGNTIVNENQIDVGNVLSELQYKADRDLSNCTKPYIIETYINGTSGYNVYSNRWSEQWGETPKTSPDAQQTITFLKPFANTDYYFNRSCLMNNRTGTTTGYFTGYFNKTANSVTIQSSSYTDKTSWYACGYIA